jgi:HPt (histidine-containing phosphotransfer) domain-containing protein
VSNKTSPKASIAAVARAAPGHLDTEMLDQLRQSHPALFERMMETFLGYAPEMLSHLKRAAIEGDRAALRTTAHSLKSSSANVGASSVTDLCRRLEHLLRSNPGASLGVCKSLAAEIETEMASVLKELKKMVPSKTKRRASAPQKKSARIKN